MNKETGAPVPIIPMSLEKPLPRTASYEAWPPAGILAPKNDMPGWGTTIWRGMRCICPACGKAPIFDGFLKVYPNCLVCRAPLGEMPADDAPPYIAMLVVLHFVTLFLVMIFKFGWHPAAWQYGLLLILLVLVCMVALRMAKGAVIGILLKLGLKRQELN